MINILAQEDGSDCFQIDQRERRQEAFHFLTEKRFFSKCADEVNEPEGQAMCWLSKSRVVLSSHLTASNTSVESKIRI